MRCTAFFALATCSAADVTLVSFDGAAATTYTFQELNDPVMGGKSTGTWSVSKDGYGVFDGEVVDVPSLKAPGFIKAAADGHFADVSSAIDGALVLMVRTSTPQYKGFAVSFASGTMSPAYSCSGGGSIPFSRGCFKTKFSVPAGDAFTPIVIPWRNFSDNWSPATGDPTSTCAENPSVCPTAAKLKAIKRIEVWGEGALGKVHLEIQSISASTSSYSTQVQVGTRPDKGDDLCSGPVQTNLRYNISSRTTPDVPVPVGDGENLAEAVCCDKRTLAYAEPQFLFQAPDISLFTKLDKGVTTFYDSVCGVPLFRTPVNRTLEDFKADTTEHGWPSFRPAEVNTEHVKTDVKTGLVTSSCGTHLGSYLPDAKGPRWCMDLSCISGNPSFSNDRPLLIV
eukprot:gnl/MRDRNA2_/MRDRNA2_96637_c0_seq1.p1 gnl/MRDRNA2_/MRDRNA2_96637_c0~~gnl/MRDRNA2_/MRDRNA2_96637_c0_seq1.p1  ORF type:complete len:396 (-),score=62.04 gnl/MRDRNA2_/MRDRNA2_96637_c0_seq1:380-1567(-)